jgi:single-stranded-DNA-specific exonuclease
MTKTWRVRPTTQETPQTLANHLALSPLAAQVLTNRGIETPEDGIHFLKPSLSQLRSPFLMKDMSLAVDRVIRAVEHREEVVIYGDYDVDGITATAILVAFLRELGMTPRYYIPHRVEEGYGLNENAVRRFGSEDVTLIMTADCGISNTREIEEASRLGIDTIVIDHHEVPEVLPRAVAILNPKQKNCSFPFDKFAGVGVAFEFLIALRATLRERGFWQNGHPPNLKEYLDLVSLGTVSDMVPLLDTNRVLVKFGLEELTKGRRQGIRALKSISNLEGRCINTGHVAFQLSPRLNACGRLDRATRAVELLLSRSEGEASGIASELDRLNKRRQRMEERILDEVLQEIDVQPGFRSEPFIFFSSPTWHPGVIGIVASRLVERFGKPSFLIAIDDEEIGKGSARSVDGVDIYAALKGCEGALTRFGGHPMAAGFTVPPGSITELRALLSDLLRQQADEGEKTPVLRIDAEVELTDIDRCLIEDLSLLEPHGMGNPRPLFVSRNVKVNARRVVGADSLKLSVQGGQTFDAIGFGMAGLFSLTSGSIDLVFTPQLNHWKGSERIELEMRDLVPHTQSES